MYGNGERGEERVGGGKGGDLSTLPTLLGSIKNIDVDLSLSVVEHSQNKKYLLRALHVRNKFDEK